MVKRLFFLFTTACRQGICCLLFVSELPSVFLSLFLSFFHHYAHLLPLNNFTKNAKQEMLIIIFMVPTSEGREGRKAFIYIYIYIYMKKESELSVIMFTMIPNFFPHPDRLTIDSAAVYIHQCFSPLSPTYFQLAIPDLHNNSLATVAGKFSSVDWVLFLKIKKILCTH